MWDLAAEGERKGHFGIPGNASRASLRPAAMKAICGISSFRLQVEALTCQYISHDGIPEKGDVVDDVPETLEVGEDVVDGVGRRLQGDFDPGEELGCEAQEGEFIQRHSERVSRHLGFTFTSISHLRVVQFCPVNPVRVQSHS